MELTEKTVNYCTFAWKLPVPSSDEDGDSGAHADTSLADNNCHPDQRESWTIPCQQLWTCWITRKSTRLTRRQRITAMDVHVMNLLFQEELITGFYKISIIDKEGKTLPEEIQYAYVDYNSLYRGLGQITLKFEQVNLSEDPRWQIFRLLRIACRDARKRKIRF